jgi:hypothetical protein
MAEAPAFDKHFNADLVNTKSNSSWPISSYFYMLIAKTSMTDAKRAEYLVDWIWWIVSTIDGDHLADLNRSTCCAALDQSCYLTVETRYSSFHTAALLSGTAE